jgi:hypothetical protein
MSRRPPEEVHKYMSHIRSKNTKPEMIVRKGLWKRGFRYRLNHKRLPGHPDVVLRKYRTCIFIKILANAVVGTGVFDEKDETDAVIADKPVENSHDVLMYAIAPAYRKKTEYAGKLAIGVKDGVLNDVDYSAIGYIMFHYWSNKRATPYKLYSPPRLVSKHDIPDGYLLRMADGAEMFLLLEYEPYKPADIGAYNIMKVQRHGKVRYLPFVIHQTDINTIVNEVTAVRELEHTESRSVSRSNKTEEVAIS